jgi:ABC-type transport system involved in Fe-S cluster assembly fused permease/ATPase subunit
LAAQKMMAGSMSIGDFVLVNQFILTLYTPLAFLGMYYRMLKQLVVDGMPKRTKPYVEFGVFMSQWHE